MRLRQLFENLDRTGEGKAAVVGWGRGMGHKGHMYLADAVITQADETGADPYFVVSRTVGKDDPITPDEKLDIYKKVFPKHGHIFHTATDEMPDLTRVLSKLNQHGYTDVTVVVGADQKNALSYVKNYNNTPDKSGNIPYTFDNLDVISRQETNSKYSQEEGPRATPMRHDLMDPSKSEEEKFSTWRDSMSPELSDDEVRDLMHKAHTRMKDPNFGKAPKKEKVAAEGMMDLLSKSKDTVKKKLASAEEMRKYFEKEKVKDQPKQVNLKDPKNVQAVHTRSAYEDAAGVGTITKQNSTVDVNKNTPRKNLRAFNLIKEANKQIREMRSIKEMATTARSPDVDAVSQGVIRTRDKGGYDRAYHLNRMGMAMAMSDGKSTKAVDSPADTWAEKYNTYHPYTKEEDNMVRSAMKTVPTDGKHVSTYGKSKEPDGTQTISPVAKPKTNKYGV
jgi:hypothetical protein